MITKSRFSMMTAAVLVVFVLSAMWTVPAFADDTTPPPVEPTVEVPLPVDEPAVADAPPVEAVVPADAVPTEAAPVEAAPTDVIPTDVVPVDVVPADAAPADVTITEVLAQVPEGTEVQVVDANGEALPLASQAAADVVATGDPIWCPVGVVPKANTGGCSPSFTSFTNDATPTDAGLINWLNTIGAATVSKAGVIWVAFNYNSGVEIGPITIDGSSVAGTMENFALTIKGGWSGAANTVTNPETPSVFNGVSLSIINWKGNVTISDILIDGAGSNPNTSGGFENSALLVDTTRNIQLDRVTVKDSLDLTVGAEMIGATLDNRDSGAVASTVVVNNGTFENNESDGLHIYSAGVVTMTSIIADGNDVGGVVIDNTYHPSLTSSGDRAVTLKGTQEYHNNVTTGLTVISRGLVTISNVIASGNFGNGVDIDNHTSVSNQGVTIAGTNLFNKNATGLTVLSHGNITTYNIFASENGDGGVKLDNCDGVGLDDCRVVAAKYVNMLGYNYFSNNLVDGLDVSTFGAIYAYNLTASDNTGNGARLNNKKLSTANKESVGTIGLYGYNVFNNNDLDGLNALSNNNILAYNLTASNNLNDGVDLTVNKVQPTIIATTVNGVTTYTTITTANITLYGVNNFIQNTNGDGLKASADGVITLYNVNSKFNGQDGADLTTTTAGYGITMLGTNFFTWNSAAGLLANSTGTITLYNINATSNVGNGATLNNTTTGYAINMYGANSFTDNGSGLLANSKGAITLYNVTSMLNDQFGASLTNINVNPAYRYNVALLGTNSFNLNGTDGLLVKSYGAITVYYLTANGNGKGVIDENGNGATLDNCNSTDYATLAPCTATYPFAVTLYGYVRVSDNDYRGLQVYSLGQVTLYNAIASGNINVGVHINNKFNPSINPAIVRGVTLAGTNIFSNNNSTGLFIRSYGAITLANINAYYNGDSTSGSGSGAMLDNSLNRTPLQPEASIAAKNITITGVNSFVGNYTFGLNFNSNGIVTLTRISASGNDWGAANGDIGAGVKGRAKSITLTCGQMFGNGVEDAAPGYDLRVGLIAAGTAAAIPGVLTIKGIYSAGNGGVDNNTPLVAGPPPVIVKACALP